MSFKRDLLMSELLIMMEKEREMKDLYGKILDKLENPTLHARIQSIWKEKTKHIGYVEIIKQLLSDAYVEPATENKE